MQAYFQKQKPETLVGHTNINKVHPKLSEKQIYEIEQCFNLVCDYLYSFDDLRTRAWEHFNLWNLLLDECKRNGGTNPSCTESAIVELYLSMGQTYVANILKKEKQSVESYKLYLEQCSNEPLTVKRKRMLIEQAREMFDITSQKTLQETIDKLIEINKRLQELEEPAKPKIKIDEPPEIKPARRIEYIQAPKQIIWDNEILEGKWI